MPAWRSLVVSCIVPLAVMGCAAQTDDDDDPNEPEAVTADELRSGVAATKGFVEPAPDAAQLAEIMGRYPQLDPQHAIADNLLRAAVPYYDANKGRLRNHAFIAIVDFSLSSAKNRFFVVNMKTGAVTPHKVAHGSGSDPSRSGTATSFGNTNESNKSSLGFVLTAETYSGKHGRSLRLDGLSSTDSNLRARAIVVHGASYVNDGSAGIQGRSSGCFALDEDVKDGVITAIKDGALLYAGLGTR